MFLSTLIIAAQAASATLFALVAIGLIAGVAPVALTRPGRRSKAASLLGPASSGLRAALRALAGNARGEAYDRTLGTPDA